MGSVNQLYRFHVPFDAEKFMQSHKDCPQDLQLLEKLWQLVQPTAFWRDAAIAENYLDLCFKNNFKHDVVIEAIAKDGVLTVSLLRGTK